jgi:hypothetical protein
VLQSLEFALDSYFRSPAGAGARTWSMLAIASAKRWARELRAARRVRDCAAPRHCAQPAPVQVTGSSVCNGQT